VLDSSSTRTMLESVPNPIKIDFSPENVQKGITLPEFYYKNLLDSVEAYSTMFYRTISIALYLNNVDIVNRRLMYFSGRDNYARREGSGDDLYWTTTEYKTKGSSTQILDLETYRMLLEKFGCKLSGRIVGLIDIGRCRKSCDDKGEDAVLRSILDEVTKYVFSSNGSTIAEKWYHMRDSLWGIYDYASGQIVRSHNMTGSFSFIGDKTRNLFGKHLTSTIPDMYFKFVSEHKLFSAKDFEAHGIERERFGGSYYITYAGFSEIITETFARHMITDHNIYPDYIPVTKRMFVHWVIKNKRFDMLYDEMKNTTYDDTRYALYSELIKSLHPNLIEEHNVTNHVKYSDELLKFILDVITNFPYLYVGDYKEDDVVKSKFMLLNKYFARNITETPGKNTYRGWGVPIAKKYNVRDYGWTDEHISSILNTLSTIIIPNTHSLLHDYMSIFETIPISTPDKVLENLPASELEFINGHKRVLSNSDTSIRVKLSKNKLVGSFSINSDEARIEQLSAEISRLKDELTKNESEIKRLSEYETKYNSIREILR